MQFASSSAQAVSVRRKSVLAGRMARIAVRAVVDIIPDTRVLVVHRGLVVLMTTYAREDRVIGRVVMAIGARLPLACVRAGVDRKPRMVEPRSRPRHRCVTGLTSGRESGRNVIRISCASEIGTMTRIAVCRSAGVASSHVATGARGGSMRTGERKPSQRVIERRGTPHRGAVTKLAIRREPSGPVVRICRVVVVVQVA